MRKGTAGSTCKRSFIFNSNLWLEMPEHVQANVVIARVQRMSLAMVKSKILLHLQNDWRKSQATSACHRGCLQDSFLRFFLMIVSR